MQCRHIRNAIEKERRKTEVKYDTPITNTKRAEDRIQENKEKNTSSNGIREKAACLKSGSNVTHMVQAHESKYFIKEEKTNRKTKKVLRFEVNWSSAG